VKNGIEGVSSGTRNLRCPAALRGYRWLLLVPLLCTAGRGQGDAVVATVDGVAITRGEFLSRYSLGIFPYKDLERLGSVVKRQFLYALIGEKLLAAEAGRRGVDKEENFLRSMRAAEASFVRDKLYRDSVRALVRVTDEEVRRGFYDRQREVEYQFLFTSSETEITNLRRLLDDGIPFDTLLAAQRSSSSPAGAEASASLEPEIRQAIRRLGPGQVSKPIRAPSGFYLIRKVDYRIAISSEAERERATASIRDELRREKESERARAFVSGVWQGRKAEVNPRLFQIIGQSMARCFREMARDERATLFQLSSRHYDSLRSECGAALDAPFAVIGGETYRTSDFLDDLESRSFRVRSSEIKRFGALFRSMVNDQLDVFLVTELGYQLRLQYAPEVRRDLEMWTANGLAQSFPDDLWEQFIAVDDSAWAFFVANAARFESVPEVKIVEVLNADSAVMADVLMQFSKGAEMRKLAMAYSQRPGARERGGEVGFFPVTEHGIIGRKAFGMSIADRSGVLRVPEGLSFFQLVDKRYPGKAVLRTMQDLKNEIGARFKSQITQRKVDALVTAMARRADIRVNEEALRGLDPPPGQMFTIRYLGFGGNIPAVPGVMPVYEAVIEGMAGKPGL
jgi:hypothetical protein